MKRNSSAAFTLIELLVVISIIAVLASIALPVFTQVQERGAQTKDLSNAKQIALACKLFASDNDGKYPDKDGQAADPPITALTAADKSNQAFACLVPNYLPSEKLFYLGKSAWSPKVPDEKTTASTDRCEESTSNFAYELGMTETSNPSFPLIADAPKTGGTSAVYSTDQTQKGGVWKGRKAIVIRCDQSGTVETCKVDTTAGTSTVLGPTGGAAPTDIFAANGTHLDFGYRQLIAAAQYAVTQSTGEFKAALCLTRHFFHGGEEVPVGEFRPHFQSRDHVGYGAY